MSNITRIASSVGVATTLALAVSGSWAAPTFAADAAHTLIVPVVDRRATENGVTDAVGQTPTNPAGTMAIDPVGPSPLDATGATPTSPTGPTLAAPVGPMPSAPFGAVRTPAGQTPFVATGPTVAAPVGPAVTRQSNAETAMDHPMLKPRNLFRHPQQR